MYAGDCLGRIATTEPHKADRPVATYATIPQGRPLVRSEVEDDTIHIKLHSWRERIRNQTKMLGIQAGLIGGGKSALGKPGHADSVVAPSTWNLFPLYQFQN